MIAKLKHFYNLHFFANVPLRMLKNCKTVLELGCGQYSIIYKAGVHKKAQVTGVEIHQPYTEVMSKHYHECVCADITQYKFTTTFDAVVCMDVLEHLEKQDGLRLLTQMRYWGRKVIITVPHGFQENGIYDNNIYLKHLSSWTAGEFKERGYKVRGLSGWKALRTRGAQMRFTKPYLLWAFISVLTVPVFYFLPKYSWHLLATWEE